MDPLPLAKYKGRRRLVASSLSCLIAALIVWVLLSIGIARVQSGGEFANLREMATQNPRASSALRNSDDSVSSVIRTLDWVRLASVIFLGLVTLYEVRVYFHWKRRAKQVEYN